MVEILFFEEAYKIFEKYSIMAITAILEFNYIAFLQRTLIQLFLLYGKTMTFMTNNYIYLYNNFSVVRKVDYSIHYFWQYLFSLILLYRMEPYSLSWYSNCWIEKTSIDQYIFHEKIADDFTEGKYCLMDNSEYLPFDPVFIGKIQTFEIDFTKYYCRRIDGRSTEPLNVNISLFPAIFSSVHFLSIVYKHPEMEKTIDITLPHGWFMEGNEILGSAFIYRLLMYQSESFVFDKKYEIHIMDDNIKMFHIGYNEYIEIYSNIYKVIDIYKPYDCVIIPDVQMDDTDVTDDEIIYGNVSYQSDDSDSKDK